jgi:hypothetical protein
LEGGINVPGFTNLRKLNISFNKLIGFIGTDITNNIEEMDWSHN